MLDLTTPISVTNFVATHGLLPIAGAETGGASGGAAATATPAAEGGGSSSGAAGGEGAGNGSQGAEGQTGQQGNGAGDRTAALESRMDDVLTQLGDIGSRIPKPDAGPSPAQQSTETLLNDILGDGWDQSGQQGAGNGDANGNGNGQQADADNPDLLGEAVTPLVRQQIGEALKPILNQLNTERGEREAERTREETAGLFESYPQLANDQEYRAEVVGEADQWAQMIREPSIARNPRFVELVHLATQGVRLAEGETPAGQEGQQQGLEGARGSRQASQGQAPTAAESAERMKAGGAKPGFWT